MIVRTIIDKDPMFFISTGIFSQTTVLCLQNSSIILRRRELMKMMAIFLFLHYFSANID